MQAVLDLINSACRTRLRPGRRYSHGIEVILIFERYRPSHCGGSEPKRAPSSSRLSKRSGPPTSKTTARSGLCPRPSRSWVCYQRSARSRRSTVVARSWLGTSTRKGQARTRSVSSSPRFGAAGDHRPREDRLGGSTRA